MLEVETRPHAVRAHEKVRTINRTERRVFTMMNTRILRRSQQRKRLLRRIVDSEWDLGFDAACASVDHRRRKLPANHGGTDCVVQQSTWPLHISDGDIAFLIDSDGHAN